MTIDVFVYFAALAFMLVLSVVKKRRDLKTIWLFLLVGSILLLIFDKAYVVFTMITAAKVLAASMGAAFLFRLTLRHFVPADLVKEVVTLPLTAAFGLLVILITALTGIFAPWIAPFGEAEIVTSSFAPADQIHLLGSDQLGRDMFSRIVYGARNSVGLAFAATCLAFFVGASAGLMAAVKGGWFDQIAGRLADVIMSVPSLIFALLILSIFGTSIFVIILVAAAIYSPRVFRLARAVGRNTVVMEFIEAARLRGEGDWYLIRREILPNTTAPLIAELGLVFCYVFLLIAGLSFLGLGLQPPTADWGSMVRENAALISFGDVTPLIPASAIALLTISINFVVDWMLHRTSGLKE